MSQLVIRIVGGLAIIAAFFFGTLLVLDKLGGVITVIEATYGGNCSGVKPGNLTAYVASACNGSPTCSPAVDVTKTGDPALGCGKELAVKYICGRGFVRNFAIPMEANGKLIRIVC